MKARGKRERSGARRPGYIIKFRVALKGRNTGDISALHLSRFIATQGRRASLRSRLPLAFIFARLRRSLSTFVQSPSE